MPPLPYLCFLSKLLHFVLFYPLFSIKTFLLLSNTHPRTSLYHSFFPICCLSPSPIFRSSSHRFPNSRSQSLQVNESAILPAELYHKINALFFILTFPSHLFSNLFISLSLSCFPFLSFPLLTVFLPHSVHLLTLCFTHTFSPFSLYLSLSPSPSVPFYCHMK